MAGSDGAGRAEGGAALGPAAVGAEHLAAGDEKSAADEGTVALVAGKALGVPMAIVKRNEFSCSETCEEMKTKSDFYQTLLKYNVISIIIRHYRMLV